MKKNIVRITESELKQYIKKVISEQTSSSEDMSSMNELIGKKVQLYYDMAQKQMGHVVKITKVTKSGEYFKFDVEDLSVINDMGGQQSTQKGPVTGFTFRCKIANALETTQGNRGIMTYNSGFASTLKELANCQTIDRTPDFMPEMSNMVGKMPVADFK